MNVFRTILGCWAIAMAIVTWAGVREMDSFSAGCYALMAGIMFLTDVIRADLKKIEK